MTLFTIIVTIRHNRSYFIFALLLQFLQHRKLQEESGGLEPGAEMSPIEEQYVLNEYGVLLGTLTVRYAVMWCDVLCCVVLCCVVLCCVVLCSVVSCCVVCVDANGEDGGDISEDDCSDYGDRINIHLDNMVVTSVVTIVMIPKGWRWCVLSLLMLQYFISFSIFICPP